MAGRLRHPEGRTPGHGAGPQLPANGYGLYEVSGNVWEWCSDWFLPKCYRNSPTENPQGPAIGRGRVMRGGSYLCHDSYCNRYRVAAEPKPEEEGEALWQYLQQQALP